MATLLGQLFIDSARNNLARPALHLAGKDYDYQHLLARATLMADGLCALTASVEGEIRCGLAIDKSIDGYSAIIASQLADLCWVSLSPSFPVERNLAILQQAQVEVLVITPAYANQVEALFAGLDKTPALLFVGWSELPLWAKNHGLLLTSEQLSVGVEGATFDSQRQSELAYIMFTSGSTGLPKGVSVTQANVMAYLARMEAIYQPNNQDKFSQFFEFTFDLSVHDLFVCWQAGACLYPAGLADNLMPTAYVRRHQLTHWFSVPTMGATLHSLGQLKPGSMPSLKQVLFCGEALPARVAYGFQQAAVNALVDNLYGPTEATIAFTLQRLAPLELGCEGIVGIGQPMAGLDVVVVDKRNQVCGPGEKGELLLGGDQLVQGYWQRDDLTNQAFIELMVPHCKASRWYRSGDLACVDEQGQLIFYGRIDNQIKIRGYRVELQEIEQQISAISGLTQVAAVAIYADDTPGESAIAIHVFVVAESLDSEALLQQCKSQLPAYMQPDQVTALVEMPTNASGKADRKQLSQLEALAAV